MVAKERVRTVCAILDHYVPDPQPPLHFHDPFTTLVAVLLSATTMDAQVNRVTPQLFAQAGTPEKLAQMPLEELYTILRPLGLWKTKAKRLLALANELCRSYKGKVPETLEELEALPGVGHKTASVVLCQAFHKPAFPVDTHVFRAARRWGLSEGRTRARVEADLKQLFPKKDWAKRHLQIILFARVHCRAVRHASAQCVMCSQLSENSGRGTW